MAYKITKQDMAKLKDLSIMLPKIYQKTNVFVSVKGSELIKEGITEIEDADRSSIKPDKFYKRKIAENREVNHFKRMQNVYTSGGIEALKKYCDNAKKLSPIGSKPIQTPSKQ